jgi:hypothetical protein
MMYEVKVGKLFKAGVTHYEEMPEYNYRSGVHQLLIAMQHLRPEEIEAVRSARASFAFTVIKDVLVFQYRFGSVLSWSDAAYTWHKVSVAEQQLPPEVAGEQRAMLEIVLIEATTGIVKVIRAVSFSPTFTRRLHQAIRQQAVRPFSPDYDSQVRQIFAAFSSSQLRHKAIASCTGGDTVDRESPY